MARYTVSDSITTNAARHLIRELVARLMFARLTIMLSTLTVHCNAFVDLTSQ
jgi:hypothetical protein